MEGGATDAVVGFLFQQRPGISGNETRILFFRGSLGTDERSYIALDLPGCYSRKLPGSR